MSAVDDFPDPLAAAEEELRRLRPVVAAARRWGRWYANRPALRSDCVPALPERDLACALIHFDKRTREAGQTGGDTHGGAPGAGTHGERGEG